MSSTTTPGSPSLATVLGRTAGSVRSVWRNRNLRRVQLALLGSLVGDAAYATAVTVWAYTEGGAAAVGVFTAARMGAAALLAPVGAAIADRFSRRATLLAADGLRIVLVAVAAACLGLDSPWPVYVLATLAGVLNAPFRSAQRAWMPSLAKTPEELTASNAASSTLESLAVFVGPALGGLLLVLTDVRTVFLVNVATYALSMLLVLRVRGGRAPLPVAEVEAAAGAWSELVAGFRLLATDPDLRVVTGQVCAQTFVGGAARVFLVVLAVEVMLTGASGVGLLDAVIGAGAVVGGVVALARADRHRLARDLTVGVMLWSAPLGLVVVWPSPVTVVAALILLGVANPLVDVNLDTIVMRMTPDQLMARVFGALDTCYIATSALGSLVTPFLILALGLRWTLLVIGAPVLLIALLSLSRMGRLDARLRPPATVALLRATSLFAGLPPAVLEPIARGLRELHVAAGEPIIVEGEVGEEFYVIQSGEVEVTQSGRVLRREGPAEFFGEIALLHDVARTATVTALTDTVLQVLDREVFLRVLSGEALSAAHDVASARLARTGW